MIQLSTRFNQNHTPFPYTTLCRTRNCVAIPGNYSRPTSRWNFFPDVVSKLHDGNVFVIEAKGRVVDYDREKDNIGRRTAELSGGKMRFVMLWQDDQDGRDVATQIRAALS